MKIICIGRNYADHASELGNKVPSEPVIFLKPDSALIPKGHAFHYPLHSKDVHYELELVVKIDRVGKHIEERFAHKYYSSIGLGIDFTCRDIQSQCKEKGLPWEKAKAFDHSAPVSEVFVSKDKLDLSDLTFHLEQNGKVVQKGTSKDMIFSIDRLVSEVSRYFTLKMGDLLFTGTPAGVGPIAIGDELEGFLGEKSLLKVRVR